MNDATRARDDALDRVRDPAWEAEATILMTLVMPRNWIGTGEALRVLLTDTFGLRKPHHHNCWGAFDRGLERQGLLIWTGEWENMKTEKSHARKTPIYRWHEHDPLD